MTRRPGEKNRNIHFERFGLSNPSPFPRSESL